MGKLFIVDGNAGASWYEHIEKQADDEDATFLAARALVASRFGGTAADELYPVQGNASLATLGYAEMIYARGRNAQASVSRSPLCRLRPSVPVRRISPPNDKAAPPTLHRLGFLRANSAARNGVITT